MIIQFMRWCMDSKGRTPVAVDPKRVDCLEQYSEAFTTPYDEEFPAATKIIMKGKQEYIVQGAVHEVTAILNGDV